MRACDVMTSPVVTVTPETTAKDAANLLSTRGFTALPVLDGDDRLIGLVTETDLLRDRFPHDARAPHLDDDHAAPPRTVGEVMATPAIGMSAGADVVDLITAMVRDQVRTMPIVNGTKVIGIVTRRDLLQVFARGDEAISVDVRHQLAKYGGPERWTVRVRDGSVDVGDEFDNATDRHVALVLAEAVPGVTAVRVTSQPTTA